MVENDEFGGRLNVLGWLSVLVVAVLIGRAGYLQIYEGDYYARLAEGNRIRIIPTMAPRGTFFDRNGELLVQNRPGFAVSLMPVMTKIDPVVISRLSELLKVPVEEINKKIEAHTGFDPIRIKADVTPDIVTIIEEQKNNYPGVIIEVQPIRDYMNKEEAAHTYGYVSEINDMELEKKKDEGYKSGDIIGKFGLEKIYDKELRGENGGQQVEVDVTGKPVQIIGNKPPTPGDDLYLTIDKNLQTAAEKAVDEQLKLIHANAAAVVCMNPQTGEILAMVSRPAFDPNLFAHGISSKDWNKLNNNPYHPMDNKAITGEYPPGSTFKIITGTAALTEGVVTPSELIMDSGHHWIIPKGNAEGEALGLINFQQAMAHSDNVYFYEMGNRLGIDRLEKYARMFGLGKITGIDLPYESDGLVANRRYKEKNFEDGDWYLSETFDAAIGQGFNLVTPLQAAMVMGEIAADGKRYKPHLVNRIVGPDGKTVREFKPELLGTLDVPAADIQLVQTGLHEVTKYGTAASIFKGFPIEIAGKTGTAENPHGRDHGWFVAYGPFANPDIVVAVIVEQGGFGSQSAVPIGRKILEAWFGLNKPQPAQPAEGQKKQ
ncbi:penicillin-binding protein 2 [Selenomonas ruminantium]|uniref:Penicillin-binding protein 2 n=1 Tax=Selenomonas ruminantium TaxID=971 RepID=A0A1I0YQL1_SELRU|nr:penicillin-binding protein 2 [Selenomonas ruminantium]SEA33877.1 penicillin-binding protein 2 [Selenomonas ruminantium]SFB14598.1 penicillin-binding protein 2 [Selenomonas ruminantium]